MANSKHISEDEIKYIVDVESSKAQQEIRKLEKSSASLRSENKRRLDQMVKLEAQGKKESQLYKDLRQNYNQVSKQIRENTTQIANLTKNVKVADLTMNQLKKEAKQLQKQLDDTSKSLNPSAYDDLKERLKNVKGRMAELNNNARDLKETFHDLQTKSFLIGSTLFEFGKRIFDSITEGVREFISEGVELAESADGVAHAFNDIDRHDDILKNLRTATKGTVNDLELMKAAVQAKDFRIPLEDLGKYLAFAQLKAQQTGQSVEYMTNSIVTGLGRKSKMILDNLGISAAEIDEKMAETGDFMKAVAAIVENQMAQAGETYISAADRALRKTTELQNAQLAMGQALLPWKEACDSAFGGFKIGIINAITWLLNHRKFTAAATVTVTGFTVAIIALNASIRNYVVQTKVAKAATIAWQTAATTFRGIWLLMTAAVNAFTGNTIRANAAMKLFNKTCKANVYIALATAIIAAGVALAGWITRNKQAKESTQDFLNFHKKMTEDIAQQEKDMTKSANAATAERITKIKELRKTINDANETQAKRKAAIQDLQKLVPGYHASINGEGKLFAQNTKIIDQYINKLKQAAMAEAAYERIKENQKKILDAQMNADTYEQSIHNIKENAKRKTGVDLDEMNIGSDGYVRFNDVHNDQGQIDRVKLNYEWDPGDKADYLKVQQRGIEERTVLISKEKAVVDAYSKQNDRLWQIVKENGGTGQSILNPVYLNHEKNTVNKTKNKKENTTDKVGQEQKSVFANERKEMLDQQEQLYQQSIETLKQNLIQRNITQEQYNAQELALSMAHTAKVYSIEQEFTAKAKQLQIKDANEKQRIILQQQANEEKARRDFQQKHLDAMKQYYDAQKQIENASLTDEQKQERDHNLQLAALKAYYDTALEYAQAHGEDTTALTQAYEQAKANIIKEYTEKTEQQRFQLRQQYGLATMQQQYDQELAMLKKHLEEKKLSMEEYNEAVKKMEQEREDKLFSIRQQYGLTSQQEIYDHQKQQLQTQREEGYLSEEEYQEALKQMKIDSWKQQFDYYQKLFGNAVTALQDAELANVDAKYDAEIEAARQAGKDTTDIENKKANEKLKIQKKYADVNFAIKASQIIADTAVSIMKAIADLGPIAGPIAAALMGVTGAAQLAAANAERQKVKRMTLNGSSGSTSVQGTRVATGLEQGGSIDVERKQDGKKFHASYEPDKRGYVERPTVIVGEGPAGRSREWVASNAALQNPTVAPLIDIIDRAQRVGNIATLDMRKYLLQQQARAMQQGGYVTQQPTPPAASQVNYTATISQPSHSRPDTIQRLCDILERIDNQGIKSFVALDDFDAQQKLRNQARKIASKS